MKKRKKINRNKFIGILFFCLLIVIGTYLFLRSDFFFLDKVTIKNNKYLSKEDITEILSLEKDKNIFYYDIKRLENKIKANDYVSDCIIKRKMPNALEVDIKEKYIIGPLHNGKTYCYIDDKGNLVDTFKTNKEDFVILEDYTLVNEKIEFKEDNKELLILLCKKIDDENIKLKTIDFKNKDTIKMKNNNGIEIILSKDENIIESIEKLQKVMVDLQNRKENYGKIDLRYNKYVVYSAY